MNELSPKTTRRALHHAMPQKLPLRAVELVAIGWTRERPPRWARSPPRAVSYGRGRGGHPRPAALLSGCLVGHRLQVRSGAARLITRAYRRHVEHTPWNEATRSGSPSMVIMTTPTCWPSAAATHSTHMVSPGSLSNVRMISRTSCKAPVPVRACAYSMPARATRARVDVSASWRQEVHVGWASCPTRRRKATGILSCVSVPDRGRPPGSRPAPPKRRDRRVEGAGGVSAPPAGPSGVCAAPAARPGRVGIQYRLSCCRGVIGGLLSRR